MIKYNDIKSMINQLNIVGVKILDLKGSRIWEYKGSNTTELLNEIEKNAQIMASYGRVQVMAGTESNINQNWRDCYKWEVLFSDVQPQQNNQQQQAQNNSNKIPANYISQSEANLMATVQALQLQMDFNNKIQELQKQIEAKNNSSNDPMKYLPLAGLFLDLDEKKIANMIKFSQISSMAGNSGLARIEDSKTKVTMEDSEDFYIEQIQVELGKLSEKVPLDLIHKAIKALTDQKDSEGTIKKLLTFI